MPASSGSVLPTRNSPAAGSERNLISSTLVLMIVEDGDAALEQGAAIERWFDTLRAAVEQAHFEQIFEVGDHF